MSESFSERVARLQREREAQKQAQSKAEPIVEPDAPVVEHDEDLIPDVETSTYERTEVDDEIDRLVERIDILDAYAKWCGKMVPKVGGKRESIMISCPKPEHRDRNPSAWINLDKQTWFCGTCQEGGDKLDIAAMHFGIDNYKDGKNFPDLMRRIAESEGYVVKRTLTGDTKIEKVTVIREEDEMDAAEPELPAAEDPAPADFSARLASLRSRLPVTEGEPTTGDAPEPSTVVSISPDADDDEDALPSIPWRDILPDDSFLRRWMEGVSGWEQPDEYYFWLGMQALGMACGRDVYLNDPGDRVYGNLFVVLYGRTAIGKSRAIKPMERMLREVMEYDHEAEYPDGVQWVPNPGSAEGLIDSFSKPVPDPADPRKIIGFAPIRGIVRINEFSDIAGKAARAGSVLKPVLMSLYDCDDVVDNKTRGHGYVKAEKPFASVLTTVQPRAIRTLVTSADADSGFLNRWLFAVGEERPRPSFGRRPPARTGPATNALREVVRWIGSGHVVEYTDEALDIIDGYFRENIWPVLDTDEDSLVSRAQVHLMKVMLLFAVDRHSAAITAEIALDALKMWPYIHGSYLLLAGQIANNELDSARGIILRGLINHEKRTGKGMTVKELNRFLARNRVPIEVSARLLPMMRDHEQIAEEIFKPTRGPETKRFRAVE